MDKYQVGIIKKKRIQIIERSRINILYFIRRIQIKTLDYYRISLYRVIEITWTRNYLYMHFTGNLHMCLQLVKHLKKCCTFFCPGFDALAGFVLNIGWA